MSSRRDLPDEVVARARLFDREHFREDRAGWGGSWGSVPADQVRRLLWGALEAWRELGFVLLPAEAGALDPAVIALHQDGSEGM